MMALVLDTANASAVRVDGVERPFELKLTPNRIYLFVSNVDCCIRQGNEEKLEESKGATFIPSRTPLVLSGNGGPSIRIVGDATTPGFASLTPCTIG